MSDLKHRSSVELAGLIRWCEEKRETLNQQRIIKQELIMKLQSEVESLGRSIHNIGQKEVWARHWKAKKDLGEDTST